jgi:oligopeptide/dipeptide ABC transporter ATP-binding protein
MAEAMRVEDLHVRFRTPAGDVKALNGVNIVLEEGEIYCLVGESGAGKSTLALAIMGLLPVSASVPSGRVIFNDLDLLNIRQEQLRMIRGNQVSMIFQDAQSALNPVQLVGPQLEEVILAHTDVGSRVANAMAQEVLREMGLPDPKRIMGQYPFSLSGGMAQRVMLAIALVLKPKVLIADEPTSGLDVTLQAEILERLKALCREQGSSILLITHDMGIVASTAQKVGVIYAGTVVETSKVIPLFREPQHPYTWALLKTLPRLDDIDRRLEPLRGNPPDMVDLPDECPFLPRCNKALSRCREEHRPPLAEIASEHMVACYNPVVAEN